ncbi:MAG TPA: hypothetical protein VJ521_10915, partial [Acidobacteriota bacterium]|nr:hypothetical protein [Acidobacteriota bacterium]
MQITPHIEEQTKEIRSTETPEPFEAVPSRFVPSKSTLFIDRFMTHFIKIGGISIIVAVLGIFVFILWQILPLFRPAEVHPALRVALPPGDYRALGIDEWGELPFVVDQTGLIYLVDP